MTSCDEYQAGIVALFDNEAGDEDLRPAAGHLQDCPACRAFCLDLIGIRRTLTAAPVPRISPAAREAVLDGIKAGRSRRGLNAWVKNPPCRWAAVLAIAALSMACLFLGKTTRDLRTRLTGAEQQVAAIRAEQERAESEERQQKAISALYFRMAELEERVGRFSGPRSARLAEQRYGLREQQNGL